MKLRAQLVAVSLVAACATESGEPEVLRHEFPRVQVDAGVETDQICQSWTLGNDKPIFVNAVAMTSLGNLHHSNWFFVPDGTFAGPDGTWPCADRNFDQAVATVVGGVAFAQSTQARDEVLGFAENAAYIIPPHSTIVGALHVVNTSDEPLETGLAFEIRPIREADAEILLQPAAFTYMPLHIPPMARSRFQAECDLEKAYGAPPTFSFYYMLPHYHGLGAGMAAVVDMPAGPITMFETQGIVGDVKSKKLDPAFSLVGSSRLKFSCDYNNTTGATIGWGNADAEMCILVAWTDSPHVIAGGVFKDENAAFVGMQDGVMVYEGSCGVSFLPARR